MGYWLTRVAPGLVLLVIGGLAVQSKATETAGAFMMAVGFIWLFAVGPSVKRHYRAQRKARDWYALQEAKRPYQQRLADERKRAKDRPPR